MGHSVHYLTFLPLISLTCKKMETKVLQLPGWSKTPFSVSGTHVFIVTQVPHCEKKCLFASPKVLEVRPCGDNEQLGGGKVRDEAS